MEGQQEQGQPFYHRTEKLSVKLIFTVPKSILRCREGGVLLLYFFEFNPKILQVYMYIMEV